jgi:dethiobiotin synthetase
MSGLVVIGTDTGAGKTVVAAGIAGIFKKTNISVGVMKPVATGGIRLNARLVSPDALFLSAAATVPFEPELVNPYCYELPVVPVVAARGHEPINLDVIKERFGILQHRYDIVVVEGVGGLLVPLSDELMLPDLIWALNLPVLIVARANLGTINHTLLTIQRARAAGLEVLGFVMNRVGNKGVVEQTSPSIISRFADAPCLGKVEEGTGIDVDSCSLGNTVEIVERGLDWGRLLQMIRAT